MKRVLITGATSMIGIALISECLKNNVEVYAVVRPNSANYSRIPQDDRIHILEYELDDLNKIGDLDIEVDVFYHFAWITGKKSRNDASLQIKNIQYTLNAVELASRLKCCKFIGAGSQAEYGWKSEKIQEETSATPETAYGMCKLVAGSLTTLMCQQYGIIPIWGRVFSVYGTLDKKETMIQYAIEQFSKGEKASFSAATQMWDYLFSADAGKAFYLLGTSENVKGIYNIASGRSIPLKEFIYDIKNNFFPDAVIEFAPVTSETPKGIVCDIEKLRRDTGFTPGISFREGIQKMIKERNYNEEN